MKGLMISILYKITFWLYTICKICAYCISYAIWRLAVCYIHKGILYAKLCLDVYYMQKVIFEYLQIYKMTFNSIHKIKFDCIYKYICTMLHLFDVLWLNRIIPKNNDRCKAIYGSLENKIKIPLIK
jgi:hypothetical protein